MTQTKRKTGYAYLQDAIEKMREEKKTDAEIIDTLAREIPVDVLKRLYREAPPSVAQAIERVLFG